MSSASRIHAISFDADDTLFDSQSTIRKALEPMSAMLDTPVEELQRMRLEVANANRNWKMQDIRVESWRQVMIDCGVEPDEKLLVEFWKAFTKLRIGMTQLFDETVEVLRLLRQHGFRLAVLSNGNMDFAAMGLDHYFDDIFLAEYSNLRKPNLDAFEQVTRAFDLRPEQILHVGDNLVDDHIGATQHGFESLLLCRSHSDSCKHDDRYITDLRQIIPLL